MRVLAGIIGATMLVMSAIGCATGNPPQKVVRKVVVHNTVDSQFEFVPQVDLTGNRIYFDLKKASGAHQGERLGEIKSAVEQSLKDRGFVKTDELTAAHLVVHVGHDKSFLRDRKMKEYQLHKEFLAYHKETSEQDSARADLVAIEKKLEDFKEDLEALKNLESGIGPMSEYYVIGEAQQHGKRPSTLFRWRLSSRPKVDELTRERFATEVETLSSKLADLKSPKTNEEKPGCYPYLGFDGELTEEGYQAKLKVKKVFPNSGSEEAGIQKGDLIDKVNNLPYYIWINGSSQNEVYAKNKVPVEIIRAQKPLKKHLTPKTTCITR